MSFDVEHAICRRCGCDCVNVYTDECFNCGYRDRLIQNPLGLGLPLLIAAVAALVWRVVARD